jgi:hypothetical protein
LLAIPISAVDYFNSSSRRPDDNNVSPHVSSGLTKTRSRFPTILRKSRWHNPTGSVNGVVSASYSTTNKVLLLAALAVFFPVKLLSSEPASHYQFACTPTSFW